MKLVDLHKRGEIDREKIIKLSPEKTLKFLLLEDPSLNEIQSDLAASLQSSLTVEQLLKCSSDISATLLKSSPSFRATLETKLISYLNRTEIDIINLEEVSTFLCALFEQCDKDIAVRFLEKIENNINVGFVREELINIMTVKIKLLKNKC